MNNYIFGLSFLASCFILLRGGSVSKGTSCASRKSNHRPVKKMGRHSKKRARKC